MKRQNRNKKKKPAPNPRSGIHAPGFGQRLLEIAEPVCTSEGVLLIDLERVREFGDDIIRLAVDTADGVSLDVCTVISRELSRILSVELDPRLTYRLEVSSPGIDRSLDTTEALEAANGETVKVLMQCVDEAGPRPEHMTGRISQVTADALMLTANEQTTEIPLETITRVWRLKSDGDEA